MEADQTVLVPEAGGATREPPLWDSCPALWDRCSAREAAGTGCMKAKDWENT